MRLFRYLRNWLRRRTYYTGAVVRQFLVPDVVREVEVVDASELDLGFIDAKIRTWNLLYVAQNLAPEPTFGPAERVSLDELWVWTGEPWGGPVPAETGSRAPE